MHRSDVATVAARAVAAAVLEEGKVPVAPPPDSLVTSTVDEVRDHVYATLT
jgi:hypothetical protein